MSLSPTDSVQELYIAAYGRPADPSGLQYWVNVLNQNGDNLNAILSNFTNSTEANNLYGTINSSSLPTVINNIYENLFNRSADQSGLQYWENAYNTNQMSVGNLAYDIMQGAQNNDVTVINNKIATAQAITNNLANNPNISITQGESPLIGNFLQSVSTSVPSSSTIQNFLNTMNDQNIVQSLYLVFYDRPADPGGLSYWSSVLSQSANNINAILPSFASSQESATLYGNVQPTPDLNTLINAMDNYLGNLFTMGGETTPNLQGLNNAITSYYQDYANGNLSNVANDFNNLLNQFDNLMINAATQAGVKLTTNDLQPLNTLFQNEYLSGQIPTESSFVNAFDAFFTSAANTNNEPLSSSDLAQLNSILDSDYQSLFSAMQSQINTIDNMINTIYQNLFGRSPDQSGLLYWQNIYTHTPNMNPGLLAYEILNSAGGSDVNTIQDKIAIANEITLLYQNNPTVTYNSSTAKSLINSTTLPAISDVGSLLNLPTTNTSLSSTTQTSSAANSSTSSNIVDVANLLSAGNPGNITNLQNNTTLQFDDNYNYQNALYTISYGGTFAQYANTNGPNDTINILFNKVIGGFDISLTSLVVQDSATPSNGIGTININSNDAVNDTIYTLSDNSLTQLNFSGPAAYNINLLDTNSTDLTINDNSTNKTPTTLTLNDSLISTLNISGTHELNINLLNLAISNNQSLNVISSNTNSNLSINADISSYSSTQFNLTSNNNDNLTISTAPYSNQTNNFSLGSGNNNLSLTSTSSNLANITNNVTVNGGENVLNFNEINNNGQVANNVTLLAPNIDINHYTYIHDYASTSQTPGDSLTIAFANTINPANSTATTINVFSTSGSSLIYDLDQAIAHTSSSSPYAAFIAPDSYFGSNYFGNDLVIVDHSSANTTSNFVPNQDAFIVVVGATTANISSASPGHIVVS